MEQENLSVFDLHYDQESIGYFEQSAKWAKFISIVGFVFCGLFAIVAIFAGSFIASSMAGVGGVGMIGGGAITTIYLLLALLWFFPCLFLFRFASQMQIALKSNDAGKLNYALKNLKFYFKFIGILFIIMLSIYALAIVGGIVFAGIMA